MFSLGNGTAKGILAGHLLGPNVTLFPANFHTGNDLFRDCERSVQADISVAQWSPLYVFVTPELASSKSIFATKGSANAFQARSIG